MKNIFEQSNREDKLDSVPWFGWIMLIVALVGIIANNFD
jgi:hypothetical protein